MQQTLQHTATEPALPRPDAPCDHCGLPVGPYPVGDSPYFCCTGCAIVYEALQSAGFGDTYYRLRTTTPSRRQARPARTRLDPLHLSELDSERFIAEHTVAVDKGLREAELFLDGVHCAACVWLVERLPYELGGVEEARLDLPRARLTLRYRPAAVPLSSVARWLARFGYEAHPARGHDGAGRTQAERRLLAKMGICWALAGNVMLLAFAFYAGLDLVTDPMMAAGARWLSLGLAIPAVFYGGSEFFRRAGASLRLALRSRRLTGLHLDTPISLGLLVGFGHSAWATLSGRGEVWFDSVTVLIAALLTARWLQLRSRRIAGDATERHLSLIPQMVRRLTSNNTTEIVRAEEIDAGDLIEVPAGEVIPVDGVVAAGRSRINNAVLTGESRPMAVAPGDTVDAGATNLTQPLRVRAEASGEATRVGRLLMWMQGQGTPAPVVLLADRLSGYFVATVLALAALTTAMWLAIAPEMVAAHVVALLVVTCPCALGMATPLAMAVASGKAARTGLFIKHTEAIQQLTRIDAVVLDKTGTLTAGRMTLADWTADDSLSPQHAQRLLDLAARLESESNHPIAAAFTEARPVSRRADAPHVGVFEAIAGSGVRGMVDGLAVMVGRPAWIISQTGPMPAALQDALQGYVAGRYTPVAIAVNGVPRMMLAFGDTLRPEAKALIDPLRQDGKTIYLLSGDHAHVVRHVATELGLAPEQAFGEVGPEAKQQFIEHLQQQGLIVAMVGDGVNDAAALQAADIGIAVEGGTTPSLVAADVFMTQSGLHPLHQLLAGSHRVMRTIKLTLGLSLVYNALGAAAAMAGLVTPLVAAIAMPASSLLVVALAIARRSFTPMDAVSPLTVTSSPLQTAPSSPLATAA